MDGRQLLALHEHELEDGLVLIDVRGEVDLFSVDELRAALEDAEEAGHVRLIVDLSAVNMIDSTGLAALVGVHRRLLRVGGEMIVIISSAKVWSKFTMTGLDNVFPVASTRQEAISRAH
ncbi:MAG: STAS domain-containing protein [Actinobacteria bacterium]|nr:MAG: STAS domain-containing protein [Actinomycetota bacterium]